MRGVSVIVATKNRETLPLMLKTLVPQLKPGDELLMDVNDDSRWGGEARNRMIVKANPDNGLLFMDDDDAYVPGGLDAARQAITADPHSVHIFKMHYYAEGNLLWKVPQIAEGNVSTQMVCVYAALAQQAATVRFSGRYEGDFDFIFAAATHAGKVNWHDEVIAHYCPWGRTQYA